MTRHVIDNRETTADSGRLRNFVAVERMEGGLHPASKTLLRRPPAKDGGETRTKEFLRIERGRQA